MGLWTDFTAGPESVRSRRVPGLEVTAYFPTVLKSRHGEFISAITTLRKPSATWTIRTILAVFTVAMPWRNINAVIEDRLFLGKYVTVSGFCQAFTTDSPLFFFSVTAARSTRSLTENRITHILSVCTDQIPAELPEAPYTHMRIAVDDVEYADLLIHLPSACRFIDSALKSGGIVLVHCGQGLNRSAAVVVAYCMSR